MTEQEWLASDDPVVMLEWQRTSSRITGSVPMPPGYLPPTSDRKLRLFACACCRQVWHLLTDDAPCPRCEGVGALHPRTYCPDCNDNGTGKTPGRINRSRRAVEVSERYADGLATAEALVAAARACVVADYGWDVRDLAASCARVPVDCELFGILYRASLLPGNVASLLRDIVGNPYRPVVLAQCQCGACVPPGGQHHNGPCAARRLRTPQVLALARAAYEERQPDGTLYPARLAVLADSLEELGCEEEVPCSHGAGPGTLDFLGWECSECGGAGYVFKTHPILTHLRSPGPHVRGCWALDLILGKE